MVGQLQLESGEASVVDLPGTYSLAPASDDEKVVITTLCGRGADEDPEAATPDLIVCVIDATNLRRNLFLATQISETGVPLVIALNMIDAAADAGIEIDVEQLASRLGVPVVPTVAARGEGVAELRRVIEESLDRRPHLQRVEWPEPLREAMAMVRAAGREAIGSQLTDAEVHRILFDVDSAVPALLGWTNPAEAVGEAHARLNRGGFDPVSVEAELRYGHIDRILDGVVTFGPSRSASYSEAIGCSVA